MIVFYYNILKAMFMSLLYMHGDQSKSNSLQLVHVIFRHGNRTVDSLSTYPNDPYINEKYYPYGLGQLTEKGQLTSYNIGRSLRHRYDYFLGDTYTPDVLDAVSTNINRAKTTLLLVLAGLYPPSKGSSTLLTNLNWQPIAYNYVNVNTDRLLGIPFFNCPRFAKLYNELKQSTYGLSVKKKYHKLFTYLSKHTGWNVTLNVDVLLILSKLDAQEDWGFKLPAWTKNIYPDEMEKAAMEEYKFHIFTPELRQLTGGFLLQKILDDTKAKINSKENDNGRKIFLYSGHDCHIIYLLASLNLWDSRPAMYGSYILLEVHKIDDVYGFKIFYQNYVTSNPVPMIIPGCKQFCPINILLKLIEENLPKDNDMCHIQGSQSSITADLGNLKIEKLE